VTERDARLLDLRLPAVPATVAEVRHAVRNVAQARVRVRDLDAVALAVSEAVSNAIVHAYRDRPPDADPGVVRVTVSVVADELLVAVADQGTGLQPRSDSPGAGLGFGLMATFADRMEVRDGGDGTLLLLGFALSS
jgi:anti-sigma regulatory factor (Ser/Thr protein kinase)